LIPNPRPPPSSTTHNRTTESIKLLSKPQAVSVFKKLQQDNKVSLASKKKDIEGKTSEMKALEVALMHAKDDHETVSKELDAVIE